MRPRFFGKISLRSAEACLAIALARAVIARDPNRWRLHECRVRRGALWPVPGGALFVLGEPANQCCVPSTLTGKALLGKFTFAAAVF